MARNWVREDREHKRRVRMAYKRLLIAERARAKERHVEGGVDSVSEASVHLNAAMTAYALALMARDSFLGERKRYDPTWKYYRTSGKGAAPSPDDRPIATILRVVIWLIGAGLFSFSYAAALEYFSERIPEDLLQAVLVLASGLAAMMVGGSGAAYLFDRVRGVK